MRAHKALKVPLILSRTRIRVVLGARGNLGLVNKCVRVGKRNSSVTGLIKHVGLGKYTRSSRYSMVFLLWVEKVGCIWDRSSHRDWH